MPISFFFLTRLITSSRQIHWKKKCEYGKCICFEPVQREIERLQKMGFGFRK